MSTVADVARFLERFAPAQLAEAWDNVGLLVGDAARPASRVMTCLTVTSRSADEAVRGQADLVVTHHPLPFRPFKKLTTDTPEGRLLLQLAAERIAVYSPHTAFDSASAGINQWLAEGLELTGIAPLVPSAAEGLGSGRHGLRPQPIALADLAQCVKTLLGIDRVAVVGDAAATIERVGVACGSAGELLQPARLAGCQSLVTGEMRFHACLEAEATGVALVLAGHFASERFALDRLAAVLAAEFPGIHIWASRDERDPIHWL